MHLQAELYFGCLLVQNWMDGLLHTSGLKIKKVLFWMMLLKLVLYPKANRKVIIVQIAKS